jgi:rod shape determining protein RodA
MIDRVQLREIDWGLIVLLLLNTLVGLILIYSASRLSSGSFFIRQIVWLGVSLAVLFIILAIDYKQWMAMSPYFYALFLAALAALLVFGRGVSGAKSWLNPLASIGGQPSEPAKIAVLLLLAMVFSEFRGRRLSAGFAALGGGLALVPILFVAFQPDMGTAMSFLPLPLAAFFLAGLSRRTVAIILIAAVVVGFFGWNFVLKDYQKKRIQTLLEPDADPRGAGYHVRQSKIAIGSGGLTGKGFLKGTQSQLRFLPARHTDFVFAVLGEEFGFLGIFLVLVAYFLFLARIFRSVSLSRDRAGMYIIFMVACLLTFPFLVNTMMIIGLFPITGVPIPLLSYGGSSLLTTYIAVGLVLNVKMRRFVNV